MPRAALSPSVLVALAGALVFLGLGLYFAVHPYPLAVDVAVDDAFGRMSPDGRYQWGNSASEVALDYTLIALANAALLLAAWRLGHPVLAAGIAASLLVHELVIRITKGLVAKARPEGAFSETGAYPSGHVGNVALTILLFLALVYPLIRRQRVAPRDVAYAATLAGLYAAFRVASGEHWVSDVVGSLGLAAAWTVLTVRFLRPWSEPTRRR